MPDGHIEQNADTVRAAINELGDDVTVAAGKPAGVRPSRRY
jgi:hypothetical protein